MRFGGDMLWTNVECQMMTQLMTRHLDNDDAADDVAFVDRCQGEEWRLNQTFNLV